MIEYFTESELLKVKKQKKIALTIYLITLGVYLFLSVGLFLWYRALPYKSPTITTVKIIQHAVSVLFVIYSMLYLSIVYKRVRKFYRLGYHLLNAIQETYTGNFLEYDETLQDKDGVDFKSLVFIEWNKYKKDFFERKVLVFNEKEFPEIPENANVRYVTQGNVLVRYEILDDNISNDKEIEE